MALATSQVKCGYLKRYDRSFFDCFSSWKQNYVVLYGDSSLTWYKDQGSNKPLGGIRLSQVCKFLAVGQVTRVIPRRPDIPRGGNLNLLMGVPRVPSKDPDKIEWFAFADNQDLVMWMNAIASTLPRPSQQQPGQPGEKPPPYEAQANQQSPPNQQQGNPQASAPPGQHPYQQGRPPASSGGNTTVIVQQDSGPYYGGIGSAYTGFAAGMLIGSALTVPYWGYGWGWGYCGPVLDCGPDIVINENVTMVDESVFVENDATFYDGGGDFGSAWDGGYEGADGFDGGYDGGGYDGGFDGGYDGGGYDGGGFDGGYSGGDFGGYDGGDFGGGDFGGGDF